jgi:hypothetical protein
MSKKQFADVCCKYGAPMGRPEIYADFSGKARCFKVNLVDVCYDDGGAYWGSGTLYCATNAPTNQPVFSNNGTGFVMFVRKPNRKEAKAFFQDKASVICGNKKGNTISWVN